MVLVMLLTEGVSCDTIVLRSNLSGSVTEGALKPALPDNCARGELFDV